jgi:sulfopyruvate decarboxylase beta subunit
MDMAAEQAIIELFKRNKIDLVATLPCDRLKNLLPLVSENFFEVQLTREEDGVAICAGAYLAGAHPLMLIQSTGIGNLLNALSSLSFTYEIPLPIVASWRGVYREGIEAQVYWGTHLRAVLNALEVRSYEVHTIDDLFLMNEGIRTSFETRLPVVILISPQLWECASPDVDHAVKRGRAECPVTTTTSPFEHVLMTRYEAIRAMLSHLEGKIIISNIGVPSKELYAVCDQPTNFYMLGSMGLASSLGLGVSLYTRRDVIVLDGDGSLLMNPNALCSVSQFGKENLTIVALDNGTYGSTGNQQTASQKMDLELLARGFGLENTCKAYTAEDLNAALEQRGGPKFIHAVIKPGNADVRDIPYTAVEIKERFMKNI